MADSQFDIYETESGYVAVTNDVRRAILAALAKKERQLPELVKITKKAKPTLSSVHMRDLLDSRLIEECPHPTDKRKKIYRLKGRRIGTSNLPVDQLRSAVRTYVGNGAATRLPLVVALEAIAAAPASGADATLRAQARKLGELVADHVTGSTTRELVTAIPAFLEREGLARPLRLDLEALHMELELERSFEGDTSRLALLVSSLVEGIASARAPDAKPRAVPQAAGRLTITLGGR